MVLDNRIGIGELAPPYYFEYLGIPPLAQIDDRSRSLSTLFREEDGVDGGAENGPRKVSDSGGVLDEGENSDGETMYHIDWDAKSDGEETAQTWPKDEDVSIEALLAWHETFGGVISGTVLRCRWSIRRQRVVPAQGRRRGTKMGGGNQTPTSLCE